MQRPNLESMTETSSFGSARTTSVAPIALFVYNRLDHTRRTVEALQQNLLAGGSDLFVFSDAPKDPMAGDSVSAVREYVHGITGFRSVMVIERQENWGVDRSIIDGVSTLCERFGEVIVVEDDLVTSRWFLTYMNRALEIYRTSDSVMQVSGFNFPIQAADEQAACLLPYMSCWGWATWQRAWARFDQSASGYAALRDDPIRRRAFDLYGAYDYFGLLQQYIDRKTDAWDIRFYLSMFMQNGSGVFPQKSLVNNIGFDGSGVHCPPSDIASNEVAQREIVRFPMHGTDDAVWRSIHLYLKSRKPGRLQLLRARLGRLRRKFAGTSSTGFSVR